MAKISRAAVYCGSSSGTEPEYRNAATELGRALARAGIGLVYGGAAIGLMGAVADAALSGGAEAIGVLPHVLSEEIAHTRLTSLERLPTMHERKARMVELADAFLILPGGYGTLDELMEVVTWAQLRIHDKPCILINVLHFWDPFLDFLDTTVQAGFVKPGNRSLMQVAPDATTAVEMLRRLNGIPAPLVRK